jgi:hypothetical protein
MSDFKIESLFKKASFLLGLRNPQFPVKRDVKYRYTVPSLKFEKRKIREQYRSM